MKASDLFSQNSNVAVGGEIADDAPVGTITDKIGYSDPKWLPLDGTVQITPLTVPGSIYATFDQMAGVTRFNTELSLNGFEEYQPANFPGVVDTATYGAAGYTPSLVAFSDDGSLLAVFAPPEPSAPNSGGVSALHVYDTATWNPVFQGLTLQDLISPHPIWGLKLTFSPDNAFLALYTHWGDVIVLETTTWTSVFEPFGSDWYGSHSWCVFSPDSDLFVFVLTAGGTGTKYQIYRTDTWERIPGGDDNMTNPHHAAAVQPTGPNPRLPEDIRVLDFRFAPDMSYAIFSIVYGDISRLLAWDIVDKYDYTTWTPKPLPITERFETTARFTTLMFAEDGSNLLFLGSDLWTLIENFAVVDVSNWEVLEARKLGDMSGVRRSEIYFHPDTATVVLGDHATASANLNFLLIDYQDRPRFSSLSRNLSDTYGSRTYSVTMNPVTGHLVAGLSSTGIPPYLRIYRPKAAPTGIVLPDAGSDNTLSPEVPFKIKVLP